MYGVSGQSMARPFGLTPFPESAPHQIDSGGGADRHFLRIAATQRARAAEGPFVDRGHGPPGRPTARRNGGRHRTEADHDEIECTDS
jgi:hypothetical protein